MRGLSLQRRMVAASALLALVVGGVFIALILALSDLHEAREQEARSKQVTASAYSLQNLVLSVESALRGYVQTGRGDFLPPYKEAVGQLPDSLDDVHAATRREPQQAERAGLLIVLIRLYRSEYARPSRRACRAPRRAPLARLGAPPRGSPPRPA